MSTDIPSIPIAPASGCCSSHPATDSVLPVLTEPHAHGDCQQSAAPGAEGNSSCCNGATEPVDDGALIDALRQVVDPELMINIVDLGLVYSINQTENKVLVEMTLTSPACPAGPQIISQAKMSLEKLPGVQTAEIKLTMSPPWTPDRMTDDARDQLGIF
jgi:metal-sulfur cluster biosynthetic enzyme